MNTGAPPPFNYILAFSSSNISMEFCIILSSPHTRALLSHISKVFQIHDQEVIKITSLFGFQFSDRPFNYLYILQRNTFKEERRVVLPLDFAGFCPSLAESWFVCGSAMGADRNYIKAQKSQYFQSLWPRGPTLHDMFHFLQFYSFPLILLKVLICR